MIARFITVGVALAASVALHLVAIGLWPAGSEDTSFEGPPPVLLGTDSALFGAPISPLSHPDSAGIAPVADADVPAGATDPIATAGLAPPQETGPR